jgi:hypothetical protein
MHLNYIKEAAVAELRKAVDKNGPRYKESKPWLDECFSGRHYLAESKVEVATLPALLLPSAGGDLFELENTISLHGALSNLSMSQASDERLWVWLAHGPYWEYMRKRWPVENAGSVRSYVLEHYFLGDARALVRHGLARLWWFGYATYDANADDPYWLTHYLLETTDARQQLLERQFWRNKTVLHSMLTRIAYWRGKDLDFYAPRERFRRLCKLFNAWGGTMLLDALDETDLFALVDDIAKNELAAATA